MADRRRREEEKLPEEVEQKGAASIGEQRDRDRHRHRHRHRNKGM